jgi:hypothetical protein
MRRQELRKAASTTGRDLVLPVAAAAIAALALIPAGRAAAWFGLLAVAALLGRLVSRECGIAAAVTGGLLYLWAHGQPRFASTVEDAWTIRLGFLLAGLGALAAVLGDAYRRRVFPQR